METKSDITARALAEALADQQGPFKTDRQLVIEMLDSEMYPGIPALFIAQAIWRYASEVSKMDENLTYIAGIPGEKWVGAAKEIIQKFCYK